MDKSLIRRPVLKKFLTTQQPAVPQKWIAFVTEGERFVKPRMIQFVTAKGALQFLAEYATKLRRPVLQSPAMFATTMQSIEPCIIHALNTEPLLWANAS